MSFNVYINSQQILNEPIGLADATIKIVRGVGTEGLSSSFVSDIQFWGDGYAILKNIAETSGPCQTINVRIEENCPNGIEFDGLIYVADMEFDLKLCVVKTAIEDDSLMSRITRLSAIKARFGSDKSVNGVAITPYSGVDLAVTGRTPATIKSFSLKDSLTYLMKYLTDGQANVSFAGIFNTNYQITRYELDCTLILTTTPSSVDFEWKDIWGSTQTFSCPIGVPPNDNFYAAEIGTGFGDPSIRPYGNGVGPFLLQRPVSAPYTGNTLIFHFWHSDVDFKLVSTNGTGLINGSAGPLTFTPTVSGTYGVQNVFMTNGEFLNSTSTTPDQFSISWEEMQTMLSLYNVSIEYSGNDVIFSQEQDTFDSSVSISVSNIDERLISYNEPLSISELSFSQPYQSPEVTDYYSLSKEIGYAGNECSEESIRATPVYNFAITFDFIDSAKAGTWDTEKIFMLEADSGNVNSYQIREGTSLLGRSNFATGMHPFVAKNYVFKNPSGLSFEDKLIANNSAIKIRKSALFTHPITSDQLQTIKLNPKKAINFDSEKGYVKEITYSIKTGMTEFNLLVE